MTWDQVIQIAVAVLCAFGVFFLNDIRAEVRELNKKIDSKADKSDLTLLTSKVDEKQDKDTCDSLIRNCRRNG